MPSMKVNVSHGLTQEEAINRLRTFLEKVKEKYGGQISNLQENWSGNSGDFSFSAMGFKTSGKVSISDNKVDIDGSLPLAAVMFKGKIEEAIREQLERALA